MSPRSPWRHNVALEVPGEQFFEIVASRSAGIEYSHSSLESAGYYSLLKNRRKLRKELASFGKMRWARDHFLIIAGSKSWSM